MQVTPQSRSIMGVLVVLASLLWAARAPAQETRAPETNATAATDRNAPADADPKRTLRFSFANAPWKDVLQWLAKQAGLSLHVGDLPSGSFTYLDTRAFTTDEAIDRINLFLIPKRFSLVRTQDLLSVVALDDEAGLRELDAMAELVTPDELSGRGKRELLKCLFPLGEIPHEQAAQELSGLLLIREPVLLKTTNQLLVTDTAAKLRTVRKVLSLLSSTPDAAGPIRRIPLDDLDAEQVLAQIRPHVGLEPLAMSGPDVSFSIDTIGRQLLVSGSKEKVKVVEGVVRALQATPAAQDDRGQRQFRPHPVGTADMQTVTNVLQTLLSDEDVRLAPDANSNQIALLARDDIHALVDKTIQQLSNADLTEFKTIPLRSVDPRYATTVLNGMFGVDAIGAGKLSESSRPRIELDPLTGRLFVRAKKSQVAEIERVLNQLGESEQPADSGMRLLPYRGERGRRILEAARRFWPDAESLEVFPAIDFFDDRPQEKEISPAPMRRPRAPMRENDEVDGEVHKAPSPTQKAEPEKSRIRAQLTPQGILIQSTDLDEVNRFEKHVRMIAGPRGQSATRVAIYYLKHSKVSDADSLLRKWLDAESAPIAGTRSERIVGETGAWSLGNTTIFADGRLNRLFVYGSADELADVEQHLKVIDRENSITDVQTNGQPRIVQLFHARASEVAAVLRDCYAGRIAATADERRQATQQLQRQQQSAPDRRADQAALQSLLLASSTDSSEQPRMSLAVDAKANVLVVTAPTQLADEVEKLARTIDRQSKSSVRVLPLNRMSSAAAVTALRNILGDRIRHEGAGGHQK